MSISIEQCIRRALWELTLASLLSKLVIASAINFLKRLYSG